MDVDPAYYPGGRPDFAEKWEVSEDGLTYKFYLRKDVTFHDGQAVTANDVKYSIEMCIHPATGCLAKIYFPYNYIVGYEDFEDDKAEEVTGVQVLDDYTLQITMSAPRFTMIPFIGLVDIWPKHVMESIPFDQINESKYAHEPIGSGPFKMVEFVPEQYYIEEAFEDYYAGRPYLDRIIFRIGAAGPAWPALLETGEVHVGTRTIGPDRERLRQNPQIALVGAPIAGPMALWLNTENLDKIVRQALYYALDREALVDGIYFGGTQAVVWSWKIPDPNSEWTPPDITEYAYDPEKARALLAEAEAAGAWDPDQEMRLLNYYTGDTEKSVLAAMQQMWADVGIKVNIETMDGPSFIERYYNQHEFELGFGCCGFDSPWIFDQSYTCDKFYPQGYNGTRFCNPELDEISSQAMSESDPAIRQELWYQLYHAVADEAIMLGLWSENRVHAINKNVCNYRYRQTNMSTYQFLPHTWYLAE